MLKLLVFLNVWISLGAALFALFFYRVLHTYPNYKVVVLVGLLTFIAYNFQRIVKAKLAKQEGTIGNIGRLQWIQKRFLIIGILTLMAIFAALYLFFSIGVKIYIQLIIAGMFSFFYVVPIPLLKLRLREIPGAKIILISLSYGLCCVLMPVGNDSIMNTNVLVSFLAAFLFILGITIPFDIRDINFDSNKIKTIPQVVGIKNARRIAVFSVGLSLILLSFVSAFPFAYALTMAASLTFIILSTPNRNFYFYGLGVDGILILLPLSVELELFFQ